MNKTKIDPALLENVHILENSKQEVIICSKNFDKTKKYLLENKYSFTPYRFAKCFSVLCDKVDISLFYKFEIGKKRYVNFVA